MAITLSGSGTSSFSSNITSATGDLTLSDGNLVVADGHGIDFSASEGAGASSSVLDDYEEGNWTPGIIGNQTVGDPGTTYLQRNGKYTKVGRLVTIWCQLQIDNWGTQSGFATIINGLPVTGDGAATGEQGWGAITVEALATPTIYTTCYMGSGDATTIALRQKNSSATSSDWLAPSFITTNTSIKLTFTYFANS